MSQTTAVHGDDHIEPTTDIAPPIRVSTTFDRTADGSMVYRRDHHHTTQRLEAVVGAMESGYAVAYSSGMAATAAILGHLGPQRLSLPDDVYHGTRALARREQARGRVELVGAGDLGPGDVMWLETPSNPRCEVWDIRQAAGAAHDAGAHLVVDSTFATPVLQQPLLLGADVVMHSSTKFIGGHSDTMGGVVVVRDADRAEALAADRSLDGSIPGALDVWLALRGVRTLPLRIERQSASAAAIAEFLRSSVAVVHYPGLPGRVEVASRQMSAFGAIVSFEMASFEEAKKVRDALRLFRNATSLGGVESLADLRRDHDPEAPPGLIRLSVGLEEPDDLIADLEAALG